MEISALLGYLGTWFLIGAAAFSVVVVYLLRSGAAYNARTEEGHLKKEMPLKGLLSMLGFMLLIVAFLVSANIFGLIRKGFTMGFTSLFLLNFALMLTLIAYDTFVIDWFVIGFWRPSFLRLPDAMDKTQMKEHMRRSFLVAPLLGAAIALVATLVSYFGWMPH